MIQTNASLPTTVSILPRMTSNTTPSPFVASASNDWGGAAQAWQAFREIPRPLWPDCWASGENTLPGHEWLQLDFGDISRVDGYVITNRAGDTNENNRGAAADFTLDGSQDEVNWVNLHTVVNRKDTGLGQRTAYRLPGPAFYRYYRLNITRATHANPATQASWVGVGQLEFWHYGKPVNRIATPHNFQANVPGTGIRRLRRIQAHIPGVGVRTIFTAPLIFSHLWDEVTSGTELTGRIGTMPGKDVIAVVSTRGNTVFSDGWELIASVVNFSTLAQNLFILKRVAESASESLTVTQNISNRIYLQLIGLSENVNLTEQWRFTSGPQDSADAVLAVPDKTPQDKILWALSVNLWRIGEAGHWQTSPNDIQRLSFDDRTPTQGRQAVFIDEGNGEARARTFTADVGTTSGMGVLMMKVEVVA